MKGKNVFMTMVILMALALLSACPSTDNAEDPNSTVVEEPTAPPVLDALLVYHNYVRYGDSTSVIYTYDFKTDMRQIVNAPHAPWSQALLQDPMNAWFSPDGKDIVFMAICMEGEKSNGYDTWCIYKYTLGESGYPVNLTPDIYRNEDPKYNHDGTRVYFKRTQPETQTSALFELDMTQSLPITPRQLTPFIDRVETGMPFPSPDGSYLLAATRDWNTDISSIDLYNFKTKTLRNLYKGKDGTEPYYPIAIDDKTFYFTSHLSGSNMNDQIYLGYYDGRTPEWMPFNNADVNTSDACPVNNDWIITSSIRSSGRGSFDLWIMHIKSAAAWNLNEYNSEINSGRQELGASIFIRN